MSVGKLHMVSSWLAFALGARRLPPVGPYLEIIIEGGPPLFWEVDPEALKPVRLT